MNEDLTTRLMLRAETRQLRPDDHKAEIPGLAHVAYARGESRLEAIYHLRAIVAAAPEAIAKTFRTLRGVEP